MVEERTLAGSGHEAEREAGEETHQETKEGVPISKVFVDCGATVNILPCWLMRKLAKTKDDLIPSEVVMSSFVGDKSKTIGVLSLKITVADQTRVVAFYVVESSVDYNILLGRDWIHQFGCIPSSLFQLLFFWDGQRVSIHPPNSPINLSEFLHESDEADTLTIDDLETAPAEMEDDYPEVQDPLLEINVGTEAEPRPLFESQLLNPELAVEIIGLLHEYKDCFAWDYHEMPGLPRSLVEHELKIKEGFRPSNSRPGDSRPKYSLKSKKKLNGSLKPASSARLGTLNGWPTSYQC
ncbi:unnamed protein product [Prunus brigantina]